MVYFLGQMDDDMKANTEMTRNMVKAHIHGPMVVNTRGNGRTINGMEKVNIS